jgi:hypothetical protein
MHIYVGKTDCNSALENSSSKGVFGGLSTKLNPLNCNLLQREPVFVSCRNGDEHQRGTAAATDDKHSTNT